MLLLFAFWIILTIPTNVLTPDGVINFIQHLVVGVPIVYLVNYLSKKSNDIGKEMLITGYPSIFRFIFFGFYLVGQIFLAGFDVAKRVLRKDLDISPGMVKFNTPLKDNLSITINANSITLTPGTITVDVKQTENGSTFWVHCISRDALEATKADKGFVYKVLALF